MSTATDPVAVPERSDRPVVLEVSDLVKQFPLTRGVVFRRTIGQISAVDGVSFTLRAGETLGLVGESGCGKSTVAKVVMGLEPPTSGTVRVFGSDLTGMGKRELRELRKRMQIILQDPYTSLDPRMNVGAIVGEPLQIHEPDMSRSKRSARVAELLDIVGLNPEMVNRYPHQFSGGQRQRIGIARALPFNPGIIVADEPVSALDVSVQAQIINLLKDLRDEYNIAYLFISHDLAIVRQIADRVAVMYLGRLAETGSQQRIFENPLHPYTQALLTAVPVPDPRGREDRGRIVLEGDVPSPADPPSGCRFRTRCWKAQELCATETPPLRELEPGHAVSCHFPEPLALLPSRIGPVASPTPSE